MLISLHFIKSNLSQEFPVTNAHLFPFIGGNADGIHELYDEICREMEEMFKPNDSSDLSSRFLRMMNNTR